METTLWAAADNLRENSGLSAHDYATPVLGLIFLKYISDYFSAQKETESDGGL